MYKESVLKPGYTMGGYLPAVFHSWSNPNVPSHEKNHGKDQDEAFMHAALVQAMRPTGVASPNPRVGCVLVKGGDIVGAGATEAYGGRHGERVAVDQAGPRSRGSTAYVLLEPCAHRGRQGPCTEVLINAGIKRCVIAVLDPNPLVAGRGIKRLAAAGVETKLGVLHQEAVAWHLPFFHQVVLNRPAIIGKWAQTLNGALADAQGRSQWISGGDSRHYTHWLRHKYDSIMVGVETVLQDYPRLTARHASFEPSQPIKIIFDPRARLLKPADPEGLRQNTFTSGARVVYASSALEVPDWPKDCDVFSLRLLLEDPLRTCLAGLTSEPFQQWLGRPLQSVLVEGGPTLLDSLLADGLLDAMHVFINPSFLAAGKEVGTFAHSQPRPYSRCQDRLMLKTLASAAIGGDCLLECLSAQCYQRFFSMK